jgi:hypothetical protein
MSVTDEDWLRSGEGSKPVLRWSFVTDAPLSDLRVGRETGDIIASDRSGGLYLLDRFGHICALTRTAHELRRLAWADDGAMGAVLVDDASLACFDRQLQFRWVRELPRETLGVAITPFGSHIAVSQSDASNLIYDCENRKVSKFESLRPLIHMQFLHTSAELIVAAEHACFGRYRFDGEPVWVEKLWSNVGDLSVTGDGRVVFLAGFAYGVQVFDGHGAGVGSFVLDGTASLVSSTYVQKLLIAATMERHLLCLDTEGQARWILELPDDLCRIVLSPLGDWLVCGFASGRIVRLDQTL